MTTQPERSAYTVGWICALHIEYTAAQVFLDEKHPPLDDDSPESRDDNHYTLGSIGKHNVVIAVLPSGEYGTASAASVAKDLVRSFPNVRIGLMVGIGGGAPSNDNDVRLGDIVVSTAGDGHSGVFQYDFGKTIQEKSFQHTRVMDQSPAILRAAVSGIRSHYEIEGHTLDTAIEDILQAKKRLRKNFGKPNPASDLLFKSNFPHLGGICEQKCAQDTANLMDRLQRDEDEDDMQIHYGLIASANSLMKDALLRDQLIQDKNVLCFEMEAAGLMNTFPCLVIRGICDYSDSHKNKIWQGYAAMAAASYAKALCLELKATSVEKEQKILDIISEVRDVAAAAHAGVREIRSNMEAHEDRRILEWLSPDDYGAQHSDILQTRSQGTGEWLLESEAYRNWQSGKQETLLCTGIPGAGKTIMTSIVIDDTMRLHRNNPQFAIAFIYCNFKRQSRQGINKLLGSLLRQLSSSLQYAPEVVRQLHEDHVMKGTRPKKSELEAALRDVLSTFDLAYVFMDALDECQTEDGSQSKLPSIIFDLQQESNLNFFATSRHIPNIKEEFKAKSSLEIAATADDLTRYMHENMGRLPEFVRSNVDLQAEIRAHVIDACQGMFLIAKLHVNSLVDKHNIRSLKDALIKLHREDSVDQSKSAILRTAYSDIFDRIKGQLPGFKELAERVLIWITFARRRLNAEHLQAVVATKVGERNFDMDNITDINVLVTVCCGLVTLQAESKDIQLVHYTAQGYLEDHREELLPQAFQIMANDCITHLMYEFPEGEREFDTLVPFYLKNPHEIQNGAACSFFGNGGQLDHVESLRSYASYYWGLHVMEAEASEGPVEAVDEFLQSVDHVAAAAVRLCRFDEHLLEDESSDWNCLLGSTPIVSLHLLAFFGLVDRIGPLIKGQPALIDGRLLFFVCQWPCSGKGMIKRALKPLQFAIIGEQLDAIDLLLDLGASIHSDDLSPSSPLAFACGLGNEKVVDRLVRRGADIDGRTEGWWRLWVPPLLCAVLANELSVTDLLIKEGADINLIDECGDSLLQKAIHFRYKTIARSLILAGADLDVLDAYGNTALIIAVVNEGKDTELIRLLVENHCALDFKDSEGHTALYHAVDRQPVETVQVLVNAGARIGIRGDAQSNPLKRACCWGRTDFLSLLMQYDPNRFIDVFSEEERLDGVWPISPVGLAAMRGHQDIVRLLLSSAPTRPKMLKWRHINAVAAPIRKGFLDAARIVASHLADEPEAELLRPMLLHMAHHLGRESDSQWLENLIDFEPRVLTRDDNGNKALLIISKSVRNHFLAQRVTVGTELALDVSRFDLDDHEPTSILLREGMDPNYRDAGGWTALEYSQKYDGEDLSGFMESLGFDMFHWQLLSEDALTWYSGMLKDYDNSDKHLDHWTEDFTETVAYDVRFGYPTWSGWFNTVRS